MDATAEIARNPVGKHHIQPEYKDEQADAGRDCRTRLARPNSSGATGNREIIFFPVQPTTSRVSNLTRLIDTLAIICDDHTYTCVTTSRIGNLTRLIHITTLAICVTLHTCVICTKSCFA